MGFDKTGCYDQIFTARMLMQKAIEFNKPLYMCFVDLSKANDTINRDVLWAILENSFCIPTKLIKIINLLHSGTEGVIRYDGKLSEEFPINVGVKQGDVLAPMMFNLYLDAVTRVTLQKHKNLGIQLEHCFNAPSLFNYRCKLKEKVSIQNLAYADDLLIVSSNINNLKQLVKIINSTFNNFGLIINTNKTKYMRIHSENTPATLAKSFLCPTWKI